jgi:SAM-dependent methyltransferase
MKNKTYDYCRLCHNDELNLFFEIQNASGNISRMLKKDEIGMVKTIDLKIYKCSRCGFVQLNETLDDDFYNDYLMASSFSQQMNTYQKEQALTFVEKFNLKNKRIVDVGCGDGCYVGKLKEAGAIVVGVEPSLKFRNEALKDGHTVFAGYVSKSTPVPDGKYDAFVTRQVLEHVPDIHDFLQGIKISLNKDAVGLIEVPSLEKAIKDKRFFDFFPDHLNYFSKSTLKLALELNQFEVLDVFDGMNDEYNIAHIRNKESESFDMQKFMFSIVNQINDLVSLEKSEKREIAIWGAGGKGISTMTAAKIEGISYVIDTDEHKQNLYTPILHLPIYSPDILKIRPVDTILITALAYQNEIIQQLKDLKFEGKIYLLSELLIRVQ